MKIFIKSIPALLILLLGVEYFRYGNIWFTLAALALFAVYSIFAPNKGLIGPVQLPRDDAFMHMQNVQWWYWTGHLETAEGRRFGYELVFFAFRNYGLFWSQLAQAAVTDEEGNRFHFTEDVKFSIPRSLKGAYHLVAGHGKQLRAEGGNGIDHLHFEVDGFILDIDLQQTKAPVMHYGGGPHPYYFGGFTYYYSRVNMATTGTIAFGGQTHRITGSSWFDRQYGDLLPAIMQGWQWFCIELEDNRQIMLYDLLGEGAGIQAERAGSITDADGLTHDLIAEDFSVEILGTWKSPHSGNKYPMGWRIKVAGMTLTIEPTVIDQELCAKHKLWIGPEYWEGACRVSGEVNGRAYVELNGFGEHVLISVPEKA